MCLNGNESLFQRSLLRISKLENSDIQIDNPIIGTGEDHRLLALEQLREKGIDAGRLLLEPYSLNTAPAGNRPLEPRALEVEFFPMEEVLHEKVKIH